MLRPLLRALRPHQWTKNLFVLAPLVFSQGLDDPQQLIRASVAFLVFCAVASCVYLINDIADRDRDRRHPVKRLRPVAAGSVSVTTALAVAAALGVVAVGASLWLGTRFSLLVVTYLAVNLLYSAFLKHVVILDVMAVSSGYLIRVLAGAAAIDVEVSAWLLLCTTFLALFLTFSKRRHELILLSGDASSQREVLSHYSPAFLDQMINVVTASTLLSYALYAVSEETVEKFHTPYLILTLPFVLYGIFRYLYLIYQVSHSRNPTEALFYDPPFLVNLVLWALTVGAVLYRG